MESEWPSHFADDAGLGGQAEDAAEASAVALGAVEVAGAASGVAWNGHHRSESAWGALVRPGDGPVREPGGSSASAASDGRQASALVRHLCLR